MTKKNKTKIHCCIVSEILATAIAKPDIAKAKTKADRNQQAAAQHDTRAQQPRTPVIKDKLPGRNDPCPCGSGKKFKNCHGRGIV